MGWPQIVFIGLAVMSFTVASIKHGEPKGNWNVFNTMFNISVWVGLLYWGGFFA